MTWWQWVVGLTEFVVAAYVTDWALHPTKRKARAVARANRPNPINPRPTHLGPVLGDVAYQGVVAQEFDRVAKEQAAIAKRRARSGGDPLGRPCTGCGEPSTWFVAEHGPVCKSCYYNFPAKQEYSTTVWTGNKVARFDYTADEKNALMTEEWKRIQDKMIVAAQVDKLTGGLSGM